MDFGGGFDFWDHIFSYKNSRINYKFTYLYPYSKYSQVLAYFLLVKTRIKQYSTYIKRPNSKRPDRISGEMKSFL